MNVKGLSIKKGVGFFQDSSVPPTSLIEVLGKERERQHVDKITPRQTRSTTQHINTAQTQQHKHNVTQYNTIDNKTHG